MILLDLTAALLQSLYGRPVVMVILLPDVWLALACCSMCRLTWYCSRVEVL